MFYIDHKSIKKLIELKKRLVFLPVFFKKIKNKFLNMLLLLLLSENI